jgi:hypothetical protein
MDNKINECVPKEPISIIHKDEIPNPLYDLFEQNSIVKYATYHFLIQEKHNVNENIIHFENVFKAKFRQFKHIFFFESETNDIPNIPIIVPSLPLFIIISYSFGSLSDRYFEYF